MSVSILLVTTGRPTLRRTLDSLLGQMTGEDELLLVSDGWNDRAWREWAYAAASGVNVMFTLLPWGPHGDWGHTPRNVAMPLATKGWLMHMDDDDTYRPGALELVRRAVADEPGRPHLFRLITSRGEVLWKEKGVFGRGRLSTQLIVHPNNGRWGTWKPRRGGDNEFIEETCRMYPRGAVWHEELIVNKDF